MTLDDVEEAIERLEKTGLLQEAAVMRCLMEEIAWMRVAMEMIGDTMEAAFNRGSAQYAKIGTRRETALLDSNGARFKPRRGACRRPDALPVKPHANCRKRELPASQAAPIVVATED
jgi:hypothetical protein